MRQDSVPVVLQMVAALDAARASRIKTVGALELCGSRRPTLQQFVFFDRQNLLTIPGMQILAVY